MHRSKAASSLDHLVGACDERGRYFQADRASIRLDVAVLGHLSPHGELSLDEMSGWESIGFSGEVDPPLDGHKIEIGSMVALRCKRGETHLSHLVHLTESVLAI